MDEPLKPPSQQPRRFFDIVPSTQTTPQATSRPIIPGEQAQPDPMVVAPPIIPTTPEEQPILEPEVPVAVEAVSAVEPKTVTLPVSPAPIIDNPTTANEMMEREYQEVEHELPPGLPTTKAQSAPTLTSSEPAEVTNQTVVVHHEKPPRHHTRLKEYIWVTVFIIVIIIAADLLLDSGVWKPGHPLPHTNFWH